MNAYENLPIEADGPPEGPAPGSEPTPARPGTAPSPEADELPRTQERLLRLQAEFDNYRKRQARERAEYLKFATEGMLLDLLPVLDNLERAIAAAQAACAPAALLDGIQITARLFRSAIEKHGVKAIDAVGRPFDPSVHQAVAQVETSGPENVVVDEIQKGYLLEGRVLRAAMVRVSRAPETAAPDEGKQS
jgi:molecular chaperone GrpE